MTHSLSNVCPLHPPGPCALKGSCLQVRRAWFYCKQTMVTIPLRNLPGRFANIVSPLYLWVSMYPWISQPGIKIIQGDAGDVAPQLRALTALTKGLGSVPCTHIRQITTTYNSSSRDIRHPVHKCGAHKVRQVWARAHARAHARTHTQMFKYAGVWAPVQNMKILFSSSVPRQCNVATISTAFALY